MKGSVKQNIDYCSKDEGFIEFGVRPVTNQRNDLVHLYKAVAKGQTDRELLENGHFPTWSRSLKAVDRVRSLYRPEARERIVELHIGATGTGKTRNCFLRYPNLFEIPIAKKGDLWFDGYDQDNECLIDEFSGQMPLQALLKITDKYYVRKVPYKGGFHWWNPSVLLITSNIFPKKWYKWEGREEQEMALRRRFTKIFLYDADGTVTEVDKNTYWPCVRDFIDLDRNPTPVDLLLGNPGAQQNIDLNTEADVSLALNAVVVSDDESEDLSFI